MTSFSQDNSKIRDQYYNYPSLIIPIKFKPKGQIMNYETHLYSNCKGEVQQFDIFQLLRKLSTTQLLGILAPPLLTVVTVL
jgi:hypothetical protein